MSHKLLTSNHHKQEIDSFKSPNLTQTMNINFGSQKSNNNKLPVEKRSSSALIGHNLRPNYHQRLRYKHMGSNKKQGKEGNMAVKHQSMEESYQLKAKH